MTRFKPRGTRKPGELNKTEALYAADLELRRRAGDILWYCFEGMKFRLADKTFYTPDFMVMNADGTMEIHEVKGAKAIFRDDAKVKVKVCAELYPFPVKVFYPKRGGGWEVELY